MVSHSLKTGVAIVTLFLFSVSIHRTAGAVVPRVLLEAELTGVGMTFPQGKHLYLRVRADGMVEYEDAQNTNTGPRFTIRRMRASAVALRGLEQALDDASASRLAGSYAPMAEPLDYVLTLKVSFRPGGDFQNFTVTNFSPTSTGGGQAYPAALTNLLCEIERLRAGAKFSFMADPEKSCDIPQRKPRTSLSHLAPK